MNQRATGAAMGNMMLWRFWLRLSLPINLAANWRAQTRAGVSFLLGLCGLLSACGEVQHTVRDAEIFGTSITVIVADVPEMEAAAAIDVVFIAWRDMHRRFHAWRDGELAAVNRAVAAGRLPLTLSLPLALLLSQSIDYADKSNQLFNPAAGKLFALWGFHRDTPQPPPPSLPALAELMRDLPHMSDIQLRGRVLAAAPAAAQFDFGGVAKGAALDLGRDILRARGIENALLNVGGNILALGQNGNRPWRVRIAPAKQIIILRDGEAVATSGTGVRFYAHGGRRYHHIIDPRSGAPSVHHAYAAAVSTDLQHAGAISDAAATALMVAAAKEAAAIAAQFDLQEALLVDNSGVVLTLKSIQQ